MMKVKQLMSIFGPYNIKPPHRGAFVMMPPALVAVGRSNKPIRRKISEKGGKSKTVEVYPVIVREQRYISRNKY